MLDLGWDLKRRLSKYGSWTFNNLPADADDFNNRPAPQHLSTKMDSGNGTQ